MPTLVALDHKTSPGISPKKLTLSEQACFVILAQSLPVKPWEKMGHLLNDLNKLVLTVFVEQPMALPGSA